jgi:2-keto-4-pentenoate hydratase
MWRALKLPTLVFASMYDDTVIYARGREASLSLAAMHCPRLEPEVVFMLKDPPAPGDAAAVLSSVEWVALGFEVVDCPFPEWKVHPVDFLASFGLHAALVVGNPRPVRDTDIAGLIDELAALQVTLSRNDEIIEEGFGRNVLKNPAACLAELVSAIGAQPDAEPLGPAELVSTGTLTAAQPINPGERWRVEAVNMDLPGLGVRLEP